MNEWRIESPQTLDLGDVQMARVRLVAGHVDIVATDGPAGLEVTSVDGPPLVVRLDDGELVITHEKLTWAGVLDWTRNLFGGQTMRATVSLAVPRSCSVQLALVSADAVVSGLQGRASVRSVSGDVVLDGLGDGVEAQTVSGDVETRALRGPLKFDTVSGDLTVVDGVTGDLRAGSVSGSLTVDLTADASGEITMKTVSGDVTARLPYDVDLQVEAKTTSGDLTSTYDGLVRERKPGSASMSGVLRSGHGRLKVKTVSGDITLLRRADGGRRAEGEQVGVERPGGEPAGGAQA